MLLILITVVYSLTTQCNKLDPTQISELLDEKSLIYSGYLNIKDGSESALGFLFYGQSTTTDPTKLKSYPTLIWLNGLLGESSQIGNFIEIGPIRLNSEGVLEENINTWNKYFNILFVDLVVGTGFSYHAVNADIPTGSDDLVTQFLYAIDQFVTSDNGCVVNKGLTGLDSSNWFIFGEGYAAKQIVHIASKVKSTQATSLYKTLKGIGLGNAHVDASSLFREIPSFAFNMGLIEPRERQQLEKLGIRGVRQIQNEQYDEAHNTIQTAISLLYQYSGGVNIQNIDQLTDNEKQMSSLTKYLQNTDTITALQFDPTVKFKQSSSEIITALSSDFTKLDALPKLKELLTSDLQILIYNGQNDVLCPIPSTLRYLSSIDDNFKTKSLSVLKYDNRIIGYKQKSNNLQYASINNAGFHVPLDKGEEILSVVKTWLD